MSINFNLNYTKFPSYVLVTFRENKHNNSMKFNEQIEQNDNSRNDVIIKVMIRQETTHAVLPK